MSAAMSSASFALSLTVQDIDVARGGRVVAHGISFALQPGDALILRGDNGTGKTSILRAIAGTAAPPAGVIAFAIDGETTDPAEMRAHHLQWLGGEDGLADKLTVTETISFWLGLYGEKGTAEGEVLARVGMSAHAARAVGKLSTGQRRRLGLARLILSPRALWLLDEPMSGLDAAGRTLLLDLAAEHRAAGGIILMASHDDGLPDAPTLRLTRAPDAAAA